MRMVNFHTMNAIGYSRMIAANACYDHYVFGFNQYPSIELEVPAPSECPCCNKTLGNDLYPIMAINNANPDDNDENDNIEECSVVSVYRCSSCNELFALWSNHSKQDDGGYKCDVIDTYPFNKQITSFSDEIASLSSDFVEIYSQAEIAEHQGLNYICGIGYRKALEHLVDAYVRYKNPSATINANDKLSSKISNYIADDRIKTLAQKATWLGNDQTHILIKHTDRDIQDMKKFIKAMITLIDCDFAFEDANTIERN